MSCQCPLTRLLNRGCQCGAFLAEKNKFSAAQLFSCFIWDKKLVTTSTWVTGFPVSHPWPLTLPDGLYQIVLSGIVEGSGVVPSQLPIKILWATDPGHHLACNEAKLQILKLS